MYFNILYLTKSTCHKYCPVEKQFQKLKICSYCHLFSLSLFLKIRYVCYFMTEPHSLEFSHVKPLLFLLIDKVSNFYWFHIFIYLVIYNTNLEFFSIHCMCTSFEHTRLIPVPMTKSYPNKIHVYIDLFVVKFSDFNRN